MAGYNPVPHPDALRTGHEQYMTVPKGTRLHRVHLNTFAPDQFNNTPHGNARFSPIYDQTQMLIPTIYAAETFEAATSEIILRCSDALVQQGRTASLQIVSPRAHKERDHSTIDLAIDLHLIDLTTAGQRRIGVQHGALLTVPSSCYGFTRGWAEAIHRAFPAAQGIYYSSYQHGPDYCVVLFGDRIPLKWSTGHVSRAVKDDPCHIEIEALARALGIDYADI